MILGPRGVGWAQLWLSMLFLIGYFGLVYLLMTGYTHVDESHSHILHEVLAFLAASLGTVVNYWFARQRPDGTLASEVKPPPRRRWFKRKRRKL
jgi:hypothetical protein